MENNPVVAQFIVSSIVNFRGTALALARGTAGLLRRFHLFRRSHIRLRHFHPLLRGACNLALMSRL